MRTLLFISLILLSTTAYSATYYISNSGDDSNNGTSPETAWKTLSRLNEAYQNDELNDSDTILFRKGDTFYGILDISMKGYFISSYGEGEKPVISGSKEVTNWESQGGNIWRAPFTPTIAPKFLFIDDSPQPMGRYPDSDWLYCDDASGKTQITDSDFGMPSNHFNGGQCVIRVERWIIDALEISSSSGTVINMAEEATYTLNDGSGYFIQNHPNTLTFEGEWCFFNDYLYLYTTTDPNTLNIRAPFYETAADLRYSYGEFNGLVFEAFTEYGLTTQWECRDFTVRRCVFNYMGRDGMKLKNVNPNLNVLDNDIRNSLNLGININYCDNVNVIGNHIENSGMIPGLGRSGNLTYEGIYVEGGTNQKIAENTIINSGYCGIHLNKAPNVNVVNNYINGACLLKDDGGGIYTRAGSPDPALTGHTIKGNIITNVLGNSDGAYENSDLLAHGIYMDDNSMSVEVSDNILFENTKAFYIHNAQDITFNNNTLFNNRDGIYLNRNSSSMQVINNQITNNTICITTDDGIYEVSPYSLRNYAVRLRSGTDLLAGATGNIFDYNTYCTPFFTEDYIGVDCPSDRAGRYNVEQFRQNTIHADQSQAGPFQWEAASGISKDDFVVFDYALKERKAVSLDGYFISSDNNHYFNQAIIEPYKSLILFKENKQLISELVPVGQINICEAGAQETYYYNSNNGYSNYDWEIIPSEAGDISAVNDTTISLQFSAGYSGEAILRINACNTGGDVCNYASTPLMLNVNATPLADFTYTAENNTVTFSNTSKQFTEVEWDFGDGNTSTEISPVHTYETKTAYTVKLTVYADDCGSDEISITIDLLNLKVTKLEKTNLIVYPNPANDHLYIKSPDKIFNSVIKIYTTKGNLITSDRIDAERKIDISSLPSGIYILNIISDKGVIMRKFLKM